MNYLKHYIKLCQTRKNRTLIAGIYYEKHHPFIKCVYGDNNFIIHLTAKEHIVSHILLAKGFIQRYGVHDRRSILAIHAARMVTFKGKNHDGRPLSTKRAAVLRELNAIASRGENNPAKQHGIGAKISKAKTGVSRGDMKGKSYFGSTEARSDIQQRALDSKAKTLSENFKAHGYKCLYPENRKSREYSDATFKRSIETKHNAKLELIALTREEFFSRVTEFVLKYKLENANGRINTNFTTLFKTRNETIEDYYELAESQNQPIITDFINRRIRSKTKKLK